MKKKEQRKPRAYKITDSAYIRAQRKSAKTNKPLATRLEEFATAIGEGAEIVILTT